MELQDEENREEAGGGEEKTVTPDKEEVTDRNAVWIKDGDSVNVFIWELMWHSLVALFQLMFTH